MSDVLHSLHQSVDDLFLVGDIIPCQSPKEGFRITAIHDGWIAFSRADNEAENTRLELSSLATALENADGTMNAQGSFLLDCFVSEYRLRQEQARRDAEVDDMWRSAIVCQIQ